MVFSMWTPTDPFSLFCHDLSPGSWPLWTVSPRFHSQLVFGWVQQVAGPYRKLEGTRKHKMGFFSPCFFPVWDSIPPWSQFLLGIPRGMLEPSHTGLQDLIYTSLPSFVFGDFTLVAQIWSWWEYVYPRNQQMLQIRVCLFFFSQRAICKIFISTPLSSPLLRVSSSVWSPVTTFPSHLPQA